jgi:chitin disaccharide deacetylase
MTLLSVATLLISLTARTLTAPQSFRLSDPSITQRLGLANGARALIIHADDAGVTHSVNQPIEAMFRTGSISSSSIIVPSPWFPEIAAFAHAHPEYDFGIHLALTSEWQYLRWAGVSPSDRIPSLLDPQGFLWASEEVAAKHDRLDQVEAELRAQIERAKHFAVPITHLDTHMNTLLVTPELAQIYVNLGRDYHLPIVIGRQREQEKNPQWLTSILQSTPYGVVYPTELDAPFPGPAGDLNKFRERYRQIIENLKPDEVTEILVHPGIDNDELRAAMGNGSFGASWRATDFQTFTSPDMHDFLRQHNVHLITWKQLQAALEPK